MTTAKKLCPKCGVREKEPGCGYCTPCKRKYHRDRYRKAREEAGLPVYSRTVSDKEFDALVDELNQEQ